jgi:hypothetical protein
MSRIRRSLSYANVMATIAVFLALGGGAYAAINLPKNSVGTKQLKNRAVTGAKIKQGAVTSARLAGGAVTGAKVLDNSLTGSDISAATLGKVPLAGAADTATNAGHATSADSAASAATAAALSSVTYAFNTSAGPVDVPPCGNSPCSPDQVGTSFAIAKCPDGTMAIGGGGVTADPGVELAGSFPTFLLGSPVPNAWEVDVDNYLQTPSHVSYFAVCAVVGTAYATSIARSARHAR